MKKSTIKIVILILAIILVMALFLCIATATTGIIVYRDAASAIQDDNIQVDKSSLVDLNAKKEDFLDTDILSRFCNQDGIFQINTYKKFAAIDNNVIEEAEIMTSTYMAAKHNIVYSKNQTWGNSNSLGKETFKHAEMWCDTENNLVYYTSDGVHWYNKSAKITNNLAGLDIKYNLKDYLENFKFYIDKVNNVYCLEYETTLLNIFYNIPEECYPMLSSLYITLDESYLSKDTIIAKDAPVIIKLEFWPGKSFKSAELLLKDARLDLSRVAGENTAEYIDTLSIKIEYTPISSLEINKKVVFDSRPERSN